MAPNPIKRLKPHTSTRKLQEEAEDHPTNALTQQPQQKRYFDILKVRRNLPVNQKREELLEKVHKSQTIIFVGETGSGKSTQVVQQLLLDILGLERPKVVMTQPRRVAAREIAIRLADELGVPRPDPRTSDARYVGYRYKHEDVTGHESVVILATDGNLLQQAKNDPELSAYSVIIMDEAHERTAITDILLAYLKQLAPRRPDLKIIIMSATLDSQTFTSYFPNADFLLVQGRAQPVEIFYLPEPLADDVDCLDVAAKTVMQIHTYESRGDILVFLPGTAEINELKKKIEELYAPLRGEIGPLAIEKLYGRQNKEQQRKAFAAAPASNGSMHGRKVVLSTNVAETSLTIDGLVYIVDTGLAKKKVFNPRDDSYDFRTVAISQAEAKQRAGRAGRTRPGKCYRIYTQDAFESNFSLTQTPAILTCKLSSVVLDILALRMSPLDFDFIDPPANETFQRAFSELRYLGCINDKCQLTKTGQKIAKMGVEANLALALLKSHEYGCTSEMLSIVAMVQAVSDGDLWQRPFGETEQEIRRSEIKLQDAKKSFHHYLSEHCTLLEVYKAWRLVSNEGPSTRKEFLENSMLNEATLREADSTRRQLLSTLESTETTISKPLAYQDPDYFTKIRRALCKGHFMNIACRNPDFVTYHALKTQRPLDVPKEVSLEGWKSDKQWLIYNEVITGKMRIITQVDCKWLVEAHYDYFEMEGFPPGLAKDLLVKAIAEMTKVSKSKIAGHSPEE